LLKRSTIPFVCGLRGLVILPTTTREAGYTSKWGVEQAIGHLWVRGDSVHGVAGSASTANPDTIEGAGHGQTYRLSMPCSSVGRAITESSQGRVPHVGLTRRGVRSGASGCGLPVTTCS
jgi:hypothetical protein